MIRFPHFVRFILYTVAINLLLLNTLRILFWKIFYNPNDPLQGDLLLQSLYIGFKFDLRLVLILVMPILLFSWIRPIHLFKTTIGRRLWVGYLSATMLGVLLVYLADFGHYAYLQTRVNATVLNYLSNPDISLGMLWETYPIGWIGVGLTAFVFLYGYLIRLLLLRQIQEEKKEMNRSLFPRWKKGIAATLMVTVFSAGIYGNMSYYPLRWSDAFFSPHPFASSIALNPVLFFLDSLRNRDESYKLEEVRRHYDIVAEYLGVQDPDQERLNFSRAVHPHGAVSNQPNIVMVFLESFAYYKTGISGNPLQPTPNFDLLANESLFFRRFYVPSPGTSRSVFAAVTGIPDTQIIGTSTHNPITVNQHTIINAFQGYEKFYFLGGSASWRNIRGILTNNIPGLHIYEEGSYQSPRVDVWGISDLALFGEANGVLRDVHKPFFAIIQTAGNHRPYTIPADNHGFNSRTLTDDEAKKHGFTSSQEFNAFRFMDHSIGSFIKTIQTEKYFNNTIFLFFGDHGLPSSAPHMPRAEDQLGLTHYHVPFLIYAPGILPKGEAIDKIASELDILPTVASFTSTPYTNTTLGRDLLDPHFDQSRFAFTIIDHHTLPQIGLLGKDFYLVVEADGSNRHLYRYDSETPRDDVADQFPRKVAEMEPLCRALYETAKYMRFHNAPEKVTDRY